MGLIEYVPKVILCHHNEFNKFWPCCTSANTIQNGCRSIRFSYSSSQSHICDTIKGNESHVGNFQFWFSNINYLLIKHATFWSKYHLNQTSGSRDMNNSLTSKTM